MELGELQVREEPGEVATLVVSGSLDLASAATFDAALDRQLAGGHDVCLDLGDLSFCDSVGLQVLVRGYQHAVETGRRFEIRRASPTMLSLLDVTGLRTLFGPVDA